MERKNTFQRMRSIQVKFSLSTKFVLWQSELYIESKKIFFLDENVSFYEKQMHTLRKHPELYDSIHNIFKVNSLRPLIIQRQIG
jgi:hypothetical protein